ncbi:MAG: hypothetical protein JNM17_36720 [Archangium sp.]|nr:hypothetical protein [Archangium sp.]
MVATPAAAEPFRVSVNYMVGGRWLEGTKVSAGRSSVQLEGNELSMGGTVELVKRFGPLRLGGQLGTDAMLFPRDVSVVSPGPLNTAAEATDGVSSLIFVNASPVVGALTGEDGQLQGWVDFLLTLEVTSARVGRERHFGFAPVPTLRIGAALPIGRDGAIELSFLASYFGGPRLAFGMGVRF